MMNFKKVKTKYKILFGLIIILGLAQFYRPNKISYQNATLDDVLLYNKAAEYVVPLFKNACYDCHSNQTESYWYSNIVPVAWLIDLDVKEAKSELNFSDWEKYSYDKKVKLSGEIMHQLFEDKMPLEKYRLLHEDAKLTKAEKNALTKWLNSTL